MPHGLYKINVDFGYHVALADESRANAAYAVFGGRPPSRPFI